MSSEYFYHSGNDLGTSSAKTAQVSLNHSRDSHRTCINGQINNLLRKICVLPPFYFCKISTMPFKFIERYMSPPFKLNDLQSHTKHNLASTEKQHHVNIDDTESEGEDHSV